MSRLMLCGVLAWLVLGSPAICGADDAEDNAVKFVEGLKGYVTRDDKQPGKPVVGVHLSITKVTDAGLKELAPLKNLTTLNLAGSSVSDAGLKELAPLKNLTTLNLYYTKVTDVGLKELAPLKNLTAFFRFFGRNWCLVAGVPNAVTPKGVEHTDCGLAHFVTPECRTQ